ncbi:4-hydroxythreonine-4-phosphate dehydrogenase [Noviherbaspirillum sp.]|uniref:4-hydroxythreonine-4-phosphate dehydrogenase n=1 Tax=Noviherbaspirillum sp. TaxID=1926288 RepID=UPI002B45F51B|nr:4-hydroxythreonine-4-phosphate dehydrogenase [Noviherbaspirillum sp.]HJV80838.1 4-hydroxythreonine-4-phosphate dehydrogenase [Noviherbaspirillum sp.]
MAQFILMLTHDDRTVAHAQAAHAEVARTGVRYAGFKDIGLPFMELATLTREMHRDGRQVMLEVVSTTRDAELRSVHAALELGVDYLLGGRHAEEAAPLLRASGIRYFPFCGETVGHPTQLVGSIDDIVNDARRLASLPGVDGLDLLAYRFSGDAEELARQVIAAVELPVITAGSIDCEQRIHAMCDAGAWAFTIGSALFDRRFLPPSATGEQALKTQVEAILEMTPRG